MKENRTPGSIFTRISRMVGIAFWAVLIVVCILHREDFTVSGILQYTPSHPIEAAAVLMVCFGIKSLTVFLYSGILYAASGLLFPLPMALAINVLGTVVMATIPYGIGRSMGAGAVEKLAKEHPNIQTLQEFQGENEIMVTLFTRMVGLIPGDLAAMYSGASRARYGEFLTGTLLGMTPMIVLFCLMGMNADDPTSPVFILSVIIKILLAFISVAWFSRWKKKQNNHHQEAAQ